LRRGLRRARRVFDGYLHAFGCGEIDSAFVDIEGSSVRGRLKQAGGLGHASLGDKPHFINFSWRCGRKIVCNQQHTLRRAHEDGALGRAVATKRGCMGIDCSENGERFIEAREGDGLSTELFACQSELPGEIGLAPAKEGSGEKSHGETGNRGDGPQCDPPPGVLSGSRGLCGVHAGSIAEG
jgi:hypothetical protein